LARDRLAALVDDLDNSHQADLREILAQLEELETASLPVLQSWDIDLRRLDEQQSARLGDFFARLGRCGVVSDPRSVLGPHDLARGLPQESIHFRVGLLWSMSAEAIRQRLGLRATAARIPAETAVSLCLDLEEWVRTSRHSLGELLAELERLGDFEDPQLDLA